MVGGGPAGASTAWSLATAGVDVCVLDRATFPRSKPCAEYLSPQASRLLADMQVLEVVEGAGSARLHGMTVHAPNGARFDGRFAAAHGFRGFRDCGLAIRRETLDSILLDAARRAGARVEEDAHVVDVLRDSTGRADGLRVSSGQRHGGPRELRARVVVGADGLRSVVARRMGLARQARWPRRFAFVCHYTGVDGVGENGEMHVARDGYCGLADVGGGVTNIAVVVPRRLAIHARGDVDAFVEERLTRHAALRDRFTRAVRISPVRVTGPFAQHVRRGWDPGVALVGDAAEFFDPFTGEGIYTALRGGELLAPYVLEATRTDSAAGDGALAEYERQRIAEFRGKWRVERLVGIAVAFPALMNRAAKSLSRRRQLADLLIGVTGDFVPTREVLRPRVLLQLLAPFGSP